MQGVWQVGASVAGKFLRSAALTKWHPCLGVFPVNDVAW